MMKKKLYLLISFVTLFIIQTTRGQTYQVSVRSEPFVFLSNPQSAIQSAWSVPIFEVPIGFEFEFFDFPSSTLYSADNTLGGYTSFNQDEEHLYMMIHFLANFIDRGFWPGVAMSPIYYKTSGTPGNRVFTLEYNNVGFYNGVQDQDGVFLEYISIQVRLFEANGDIEYHIGPYSVTSDATTLFEGFTGPFIGMFANAQNYLGGIKEEVILLTGDPLNPSIVSDPFINMAWPIPQNTVYRFSKGSTSSNTPAGETLGSFFFPNPTSGSLHLREELSEDVVFPISVYDVSGSQVESWNSLQDMDVSGFAPGCYIAVINTSQATVKEKLVVLSK